MVEQFARDHADEIQIIGVGAQDDLGYAQEFLASTGVKTPTMLWDPTSATWQMFGARINSQMLVVSPDLTRGTELFFGFGDEEQRQILDTLPALR